MGFWQHLREDIDCAFERDPAARNRWEVILTYPGFHALMWHRVAHALWRRHLYLPARVLAFFSRMWTQIEIHPAAQIGRRFFIDHGCGVVIGETAEVGHDVTLYHGVTLGGTSWDRGKRHPTIADGVVISAGAKVLGAIKIGQNAKVGANAVVIKDVPPNMTVVGIPGRIVLPMHCRRITEQGIDLDHHLMPDPVGKAISSLLERIDVLEAEVRTLRHEGPVRNAHVASELDEADVPDTSAQPLGSE
ncbi:MAG: serine O-acetyltransferase [Cyanobacteria bacterium P01_D01_bin.123]